VNDVPALKEAHLAVAMNEGAQIAKDIADIVLLNNSLATLPLAFHEGRIITQTIFGTSKIFLVKNVYSLLFFLYVGLMMMPFALNPIHISWVTFGVINVPATLIAFRIFKPAYMAKFRHDVIDYAITAGFIGSAASAFVFGFAYLSSNHDVNQARSTIVMFLTLFGMLSLWNIHGIEVFEPQTIRNNWVVFVIGLGLAAGTLIGPYILPHWLEFKQPSTEQWIIVIVTFVLTVVILYFSMRTRALVERLWRLFAP